MTKLLIDSNVYVSALTEEDSLRKPSFSFLEKTLYSSSPFHIIFPRLVLLETANVLFRKTGDFEQATIFHEMIKNSTKNEIIEFDYHIQFVAESLFSKLCLKTSDLIIAASAFVTNSQLISWDKQLLKECSPFIEAYTPDEFLKKYV